jgi:hypothetical protein
VKLATDVFNNIKDKNTIDVTIALLTNLYVGFLPVQISHFQCAIGRAISVKAVAKLGRLQSIQEAGAHRDYRTSKGYD